MDSSGRGTTRPSETACPSDQLRPALFQSLFVVVLESASSKANAVPSTTSVSCAASAVRAVSNTIPKVPEVVLIAIASKV